MATWVNLMDIIYPVGSVYSSYTSTSPASRFGGSWTAITGAFPYYNAGTGTGGSNSHTLIIAEMPSHNHSGTTDEIKYGTNWNPGNDWSYSVASRAEFSQTRGLVINNAGGGQPHNNMPAYQTLYAWRRTA